MQKKWTLFSESNKDLINKSLGSLNIPDALANLLFQRGIKTYEQARSFFRPSLKDIHNPYLMLDMKKSVERVETAIKNNEKILIFGDYDVDGTSAVALVYSFLKNLASNIEYYVPDRYQEGYGISVLSIEYAKQNNISLIISLDCGINCHEQIDLAVKYGIDVIVCDHHLPAQTLPNAYSILNPKRKDCQYPYKELSGCGVGFKLVQAIAQNRGIPIEDLGQYFDLLALSIAADIVPITGENRVFAYFGLKLINQRPRQGIESLLAYSKILRKECESDNIQKNIFTREITVTDLVFSVGPRINAAGRMDTGRSSVELLMSEKLDKIAELGEIVDANNNDRRELDAKTTIEAIDMVSNQIDLNTKKSIVVYNPSWSKGIVGIVASRLIENFYKPSIVLTLFNDMVTGSARSVRNFDIHVALSQCRDLLECFGGHSFAAGLSLKPENLDKFIERFEQIVSSTIPETSIIPSIEIDSEIPLRAINMKFYDIIRQFAPFGPGNMSPVFMTKNVIDYGDSRIVGQNHLKLSIIEGNDIYYPFYGIAFGLGEHYKRISTKEPFHICYSIDINEWHGRSSLQLNIKDIKFEFNELDIV